MSVVLSTQTVLFFNLICSGLLILIVITNSVINSAYSSVYVLCWVCLLDILEASNIHFTLQLSVPPCLCYQIQFPSCPAVVLLSKNLYPFLQGELSTDLKMSATMLPIVLLVADSVCAEVT